MTNRNKYLIISVIPIIILFLFSCKTSQKAKIECCGINQDISNFKSDTNFQSTYYPLLIKKGILKPIKYSDSPLEIRYSVGGRGMKEVFIIRCEKNRIQVLDYRLGIVKKQELEKYLRLGCKDLGMEPPYQDYTNLLTPVDLSDRYKSFDWNNFFYKLKSNHLFEIPGNPEFQAALDKDRPGVFWPNGIIHCIEVKMNNQFRTLNYSDSNGTVAKPYVELARNEVNISNLILSLFPQYNVKP